VLLIWSNGIVPLAVEFGPFEIDCLHLNIAHLDTFRMEIGVDLATDLKTGRCSRGADELDNHRVADQRLSCCRLH
jgi:hypothetical protein